MVGQALNRIKLRLTAPECLVVAALGVQFLLIPGQLPLGFERGKVIAIYSLAACAAALLVQYLSIKRRQAFSAIYMGCISLLLILTVVVTFSSDTPTTALFGNPYRHFGALTLLAIIAIALATHLYSWQIRLSVLLDAQIFYATLQAAIACATGALYLAKYGLGSAVDIIYGGEFVGSTFGQNNFLGATILAGLVIAYERSSNLAIRALLLVGLACTMSRTSIALAAAYLLIKLLAALLRKLGSRFQLDGKGTKGIRLLRFAPLLLVVLASALIVNYAYKADESRRIFWDAFGQLATESPWGQGLDTQLVQLLDSGKLPDRIVDRAHNFPLDIALTIGLPGALLVCIVLLLAWYKSLSRSDLRVLGLLTLCFWLTGLVNTKSVFHYLELAVCLSLIFAPPK